MTTISCLCVYVLSSCFFLFFVGVCSWRFNSGRLQSVAFVGRRGSIPSPSSPACAFWRCLHCSAGVPAGCLVPSSCKLLAQFQSASVLCQRYSRDLSSPAAGSAKSVTSSGAYQQLRAPVHRWAVHGLLHRRGGASARRSHRRRRHRYFRLTPPVDASQRVQLRSTRLVGLASGPGNLRGSNSCSFSLPPVFRRRFDALTLLLSVLRSSSAVS